jgi:hypothetical protein
MTVNKQIHLKISPSQISTAKIRTRMQENLYGHNTGHFTLRTEKENTFTGVIGEILVLDFLDRFFVERKPEWKAELSNFGSESDIHLFKNSELSRKIHVKTGLWRAWPEKHYHFGIHADQKIELSGAPLILVSILKNIKGDPEDARIEGFVTSKFLQNSQIIKAGERFPSTSVVSRTDNLLTRFSDYRNIEEMLTAF